MVIVKELNRISFRHEYFNVFNDMRQLKGKMHQSNVESNVEFLE